MNAIIDVDWKWGLKEENNKIGRNIDISGNWFEGLTYGKTIVYDLETLIHFESRPIPHRKNIVFCGFRDVPQEAKDSCDYYAFMRRMHKHEDNFLTAFKVKQFTDNEKYPLEYKTSLILSGQMDDIPDISNFISESHHSIFICGGLVMYEKFLPMCDKVFVCSHDYTFRDDDKVECSFQIFRNKDWEEDRVYAQGYDKEGRHYEVILFNRRKDE